MKKTFSITGMLAGALLIIFGLVALCGGFGDADSYGGDSPYDSGYASFGADYYTYSVNNTAETASAVKAVSSNLRQISDILRNCLGLLMMALGVISICGFGIVYSGCIDSEKHIENTAEIPQIIEEYALSEENGENAEVIIEDRELRTDEAVSEE